MSDITDRLRSEASELRDAAKVSTDAGDARFCEAAAEICEEAAAEIERLRAELAMRLGIAGNQWEGPATGFTVKHDVPPTTPKE